MKHHVSLTFITFLTMTGNNMWSWISDFVLSIVFEPVQSYYLKATLYSIIIISYAFWAVHYAWLLFRHYCIKYWTTPVIPNHNSWTYKRLDSSGTAFKQEEQ